MTCKFTTHYPMERLEALDPEGNCFYATEYDLRTPDAMKKAVARARNFFSQTRRTA